LALALQDAAMDVEPGPDPLAVLLAWYAEARERGNLEPDALTVATATADGRPSARVMLFKGIEAGELQLVTNYGSRKAAEIEQNPWVALVFFWPVLMRQVRVEGSAHRAPAADSDAYFRSRPRASQLGAWASAQSSVVASRAELERRYAEVEQRFLGRDVPRPEGWGIYRVLPSRVELWISAPNRFHDRFRYSRADAGWTVERLCP
jgi:pyridoxamine 5'-phosphate oxidase